MRVKMSKPPPPAPTASAIGPCPTVIKVVGCPGTGSLPSTIAPPDHLSKLKMGGGGGGGEGGGGEGRARVSEFFFTLNPNLKKKKKCIWGGGGWQGKGGARVRIHILNEK